MSAVEELVGSLTESCRIVCPVCSEGRKKKNDKSLSVTVKSDVTLYTCHHCNIEGGVQNKQWVMPPPKRPPVKIPKQSASPLIEEYLSSRKIDPLLINKFGLVSQPKYFRDVGEQQCKNKIVDPTRDRKNFLRHRIRRPIATITRHLRR